MKKTKNQEKSVGKIIKKKKKRKKTLDPSICFASDTQILEVLINQNVNL